MRYIYIYTRNKYGNCVCVCDRESLITAKNCNLVTREHRASQIFQIGFFEILNTISVKIEPPIYFILFFLGIASVGWCHCVYLCIFMYIYRSTEGIRDNLRSFNRLWIRRRINSPLSFLISSRNVNFEGKRKICYIFKEKYSFFLNN